MQYDTLIIGAGMSGLAAGIRLAQFGQKVAILERHSLWGGLNSYYKKGGRFFDSGLHALTNWAPPGKKTGPLPRILRQLRISRDELRLGEQHHSEVLLDRLVLRFSNDFELFESQVAEAFPACREGFARVVAAVRESELGAEDPREARRVLDSLLPDPLLVDALLLPICYYGSARENDVDWPTFVVLFQSIFLEGLCRPEGGVRTLLDVLRSRYLELGGELRMRSGVARILSADGILRGLVLDSGEEIACERILSSAGWVETMRLAGAAEEVLPEEMERFSFFETISVLDRMPAALGIEASTAFFSRGGERFRYERPAGLADPLSGVVSVPNNFEAESPPQEGCVRVTLLANHDRWAELDPEEYARAKEETAERALDSLTELWTDPRPHEIYRDTFSPLTLKRFTSHLGGSVYGSRLKRWDGRTGIEGLFLCGTDQGFLGVIGSLFSGISMANLHALAPSLARST